MRISSALVSLRVGKRREAAPVHAAGQPAAEAGQMVPICDDILEVRGA